MKKRLLIGVIITECQVNFQAEILKGIVSQAFKSNCDIAILTSLHKFFEDTPHKQTSKEIFKLILSERFDGFLYHRNTFFNEDAQNMLDNLLIRSGKPVMLLDSDEHSIFETTAVDDCSAFEQITDHLIDVHGMKKIYCLTGPKNIPVSEERLRGYKNSMSNHGIPCPKSYCFYGDFWKNAAENLASAIISGDVERPQAIVCGNDMSAITLTESLIKGGIRVPDDIAVTGYDASEEGRKNIPQISSYRRPNFQLGAEAFRRIYRMITGKICRRVRNKSGDFLPTESCGCPVPPHRLSSRADRMQQLYEDDILHRDMLFDITNTSNPEQFADRLDNYTYYLYKMKRLRICLTEKYIHCYSRKLNEPLTFELNDKMRIILSKNEVHRQYGDISEFTASDILSVYDEERNYPVSFFITPLNYNENFFGYSAVSFGKLTMTFSNLYMFWINYINIALEHVRIKTILNYTAEKAKYAMLYDEYTGLLNRNGVKKEFSNRMEEMKKINSDAEFIRIQLSGLNEPCYQGDDDKCHKIIVSFAELVRSCIGDDELCGLWSLYSFAVISPRNHRSKELFDTLAEKVKLSVHSENNNCNINFSLGVDVQPLSDGLSPGTCLHQASLNRIFTYTVSDAVENPQYEKLCLLRGKIMKNPELPWNVNDIASNLYLSKSYLQKMYKLYFGKSIIMDMIEFRLIKAKGLLTSSDMTVTDIAKECGYSSYNYFVRQFKSAEGVSPSEYREYKEK